MYELIIAGLYLPAVLVVGLSGARAGSRDIDAYFLGGRSLPWWALGLSFSASTVDIGGMMATASMFAVVGLSWFPIEMRGVSAVAFAFFAIFIARWHRRAGAMTLAGWMKVRFGDDRGGRAARLVMAVLVLVLVVAMLSCFCAGFGRLAGRFLPWAVRDASGAVLLDAGAVCSIVFVCVAIGQVAFSGLRGAVYTGVLQWAMFLFAALCVAAAALTADIGAESMEAAWAALGRGSQTLEQWLTMMPEGGSLPQGAPRGGGPLQSLALFWVVLIVIEGFGGPLLPYVNQRFFAARDDREASLMTALAVVAGAVRWPLVMGLALLALGLGASTPVGPEAMLPGALRAALPAGLRVAVVCCLLGVGTAVLAATLNAGAAYIVHDLYLGLLRPAASERRLVALARLSTLGLGVAGLLLGLLSGPLAGLWCWITFGGLFGGVAVPLAMRWYWERFNGWGYALGTAGGVWTAIALGLGWPQMGESASFGIAACVALLVSVLASLATAPTAPEVSVAFYRRTGPMGWWPRARQAIPAGRAAEIREENLRDLLAILPALGLFFFLFLCPMYVVARQWSAAAATLGALGLCAVPLYFAWYRPLRGRGGDPTSGPPPRSAAPPSPSPRAP